MISPDKTGLDDRTLVKQILAPSFVLPGVSVSLECHEMSCRVFFLLSRFIYRWGSHLLYSEVLPDIQQTWSLIVASGSPKSYSQALETQ